MKIKLTVVGKTSASYLREGEDIYIKRVGHYIPFEVATIPDLKSTRSLTPEQQKEQEGTAILAGVKPGDTLVLLDERGREMTSREFAGFMQKRMAGGGVKNLIFVVGGPYGFAQKVYARADFKISLSRMTFSHEMVRLFFIEQIYRAMTILNGEPYHHD